MDVSQRVPKLTPTAQPSQPPRRPDFIGSTINQGGADKDAIFAVNEAFKLAEPRLGRGRVDDSQAAPIQK